jgi:3-hydroxyisobutyrate dehydrogenase
MATSVGFIGIGAMGWPMAARLTQAGYAVVVFDIDTARADEFCDRHQARRAVSPEALARASDVIVTMLPNSAAVELVLTAPDGVLAGLRPGALLLEMSSGAPSATQRLAGLIAAAGGVLVDAPVSGGVPRALTGELAIMAGGPAEAIDRVEPLLKTMGSTLTHVGGVGAGHALKALNNLVSATGLLVTAEALVIGKRFGLDTTVMTDVLNASTGMTNASQKKIKQFILSRAFNSGFGLDLMVKDLGIALELAEEGGAPSPLSALCRDLWAQAAATGPGQDHTEIAKLPERLAGVELP